jgi:hypothetical protein
LPLVYAELHQLARARLARQTPGQTLTPTALVHGAYLGGAGDSAVTWEGRQHFFFAAARAPATEIPSPALWLVVGFSHLATCPGWFIMPTRRLP